MEWITTKVRKPLFNKISDLIEKQLDPTITNNSQFIDLAIREKIQDLEAAQK